MSLNDFKSDLDRTLSSAALALSIEDYDALIEWLKESWVE